MAAGVCQSVSLSVWLCWEVKVWVWPSWAISSPGDLSRSTTLVAEILPARPVLHQERLHGLLVIPLALPRCWEPWLLLLGWALAQSWHLGKGNLPQEPENGREGAVKTFQSFFSTCLEPLRGYKCQCGPSEPSLGLSGRRMQDFPGSKSRSIPDLTMEC